MKGKILFSILIFTLGFQGLIADDKEDKCASFQKKDTCSKYREKRSPKKQACQWRVDRRILPFGGECLNVSEYKKKVKEEAEAAKKAEEEKRSAMHLVKAKIAIRQIRNLLAVGLHILGNQQKADVSSNMN
ncbi:MAG: hypothetical protein IPO06_14675 [Leptospiraceae bacterium]|nr:hypothetical protein [Leptospiraceae bacterium]